MDVLARALNLSLDDIYRIDLNARLTRVSKGNHTYLSYYNHVDNDQHDAFVQGYIPSMDDEIVNNVRSITSSVNLEIEKFLSVANPIQLVSIDSVASFVFAENDIELAFYSEVVNVKTKEILETSLPACASLPNAILPSKGIPLDAENAKMLRIVLINPMNAIFPQMVFTFSLSVLFCVICLYSFRYYRKTLDEQRELVRFKNDVFGDISHEFKKPLSVLLQIINALESPKIVSNEDRRMRYLRMANGEIQRMAGQTEMILSVAMDDEGVLELNYSEFDILKLVSDIVDRFSETSASTTSIRIINRLSNDLIYADRNHIEQTISNLVANALKYSNAPIEIIIVLAVDKDYISISVIDNGIGISAQDQAQIFERYSRVGNPSQAKGHGIGLNYVMRIVSRHNGKVTVKSELGIGSEFTVYLPLVELNNSENLD
ncbi:MAG: hypothetical protein RL662_2442 [Bacteroidota bacterium]|jgi:signal transduction histidine kinase